MYRNSLFSIEKKMLGGKLNNLYENLKSNGKDRARFFSAVPSDGPKTVAKKWKRDLSSESQKILQHREGDRALPLVAQGAYGVSILGEKEWAKKPSVPEKPALDGPFWAEGLDWVASRGRFPPRAFGKIWGVTIEWSKTINQMVILCVRFLSLLYTYFLKFQTMLSISLYFCQKKKKITLVNKNVNNVRLYFTCDFLEFLNNKITSCTIPQWNCWMSCA